MIEFLCFDNDPSHLPAYELALMQGSTTYIELFDDEGQILASIPATIHGFRDVGGGVEVRASIGNVFQFHVHHAPT